MESGPDPSDTDTDTPPPVCFTTVSESLSSNCSESLRSPQPDIEREKEVKNHREGYVLDENIEFEDEGYGEDCDMILQQKQNLSQEFQNQEQQLKDYYETKAAQEAKKMSEMEAQLKEAMQRYTEAQAHIRRLESLMSEEVRAREKIKLVGDNVTSQERLRSPSPQPSSPDQVTASLSTPDMARSSSYSPDEVTSSSSTPDMSRSSLSSPDQVTSSSSCPDMVSSSSSSPETEARPVTSDHSYAGSGSSTKSSPKIPPELISLKVAKKLEDCSLPSIEDVLRHCVYIRAGSRSKLSPIDIARQATVDILEVWQKLSSKFSGQVIMVKGNIQKKIITLLGRYKQLIKKSTGVINRSKLQEMTTEVGKFFDILSCKK